MPERYGFYVSLYPINVNFYAYITFIFFKKGVVQVAAYPLTLILLVIAHLNALGLHL